MHMSFWFDNVFRNFLFKGFNITSTGGLLGTCLGLASLAAILEVIKVYRASIHVKHSPNHASENANTSQNHEESMATTVNVVRHININNKFKYLAVHTSWYTIQDVIGYIVMLAVMTFNGYFTIAVILGSAFGYLVFGPWLMEIKLKASTICSKQQKCSTCIAKMERSHLLSSSSSHLYDGGSTNDTNSSSLIEVAEGLASVMQSSSEERIAVEVHSQEHCT